MSEHEAPGSAHATIARNAFFLVLGQVATTALAIVFSAALGRALGARDFGVYFLITSFAAFAFVVVDWGQQFWVIREVARFPERGSRLLGTALVLRVAGAALVSVPAGLLAWVLGYDRRTCLYAAAFIAVCLPFFLAQGYGLVFRGRDRMGLDAWVSVANKVALLALALAALALGAGLSGVMAAQAVAGVLALAVAAQLHRRVSTGRLRFSAETAREVMAGGSALVTMTVAVSVQPYLDAIILSKLAPAEAMGWFGAAKNIMGTLLAPAIILGAAEFPRLSRAASDVATFKTEVRAALRPILWLGALGGVGTVLFADTAIAMVYGQRNFAPAGTILKVYGPGLFLLFVDVLFGNALTAMGRATALSVAKIGSVLLSTALDLILIPIFQKGTGNGGIGVVVAFAASEAVVFAGALFLLPRGSLGPSVALDVGRALGAAAITALLFHWMPPLPLLVGLPLCVLVFSLCSVALGLVRRADVQLLRALLRKGSHSPEPYPGALERSDGTSPVG
jgi:O-antigen/teichoic acid export membrane protein